MVTQCELGVDEVLDGHAMQLLEPRADRSEHVGVRRVDECRARPELERVPNSAVAAAKSSRDDRCCVGEKCLEPERIDLVGPDVELVAGGWRADRGPVASLRQAPAHLRHEHLQRIRALTGWSPHSASIRRGVVTVLPASRERIAISPRNLLPRYRDPTRPTSLRPRSVRARGPACADRIRRRRSGAVWSAGSYDGFGLTLVGDRDDVVDRDRSSRSGVLLVSRRGAFQAVNSAAVRRDRSAGDHGVGEADGERALDGAGQVVADGSQLRRDRQTGAGRLLDSVAGLGREAGGRSAIAARVAAAEERAEDGDAQRGTRALGTRRSSLMRRPAWTGQRCDDRRRRRGRVRAMPKPNTASPTRKCQ